MAMVTFTTALLKNNGEDGEIGVFGAEKYFNGAIDGPNPIPTKKDSDKSECTKHQVINHEAMKPLARPAAPCIRSESSWNSQNPLLNIQKPRPKPSKPVNAKSFFTSLALCKCYCFDRNSIDMEVGEISFKRPKKEALVQGKRNKTRAATKEDVFTFPTMDSTLCVGPIKQGDVDEIGRKSLEIFGSPVLGTGRQNKSLNVERRRKMLSWDHAVPKVEEIDTGSDGSSDLFEIESLTGKPNHCYAPSEGSIEWSVVTASAADYDEPKPSTRSLSSPIKTFPAKINVQRPPSSGLLGCNTSKAVKAAGDAHKTTNHKAGLDPRMRRVSDSYIPLTTLPPDNKLVAFEPPPILTTRSLPPSHAPPQASPLLHIQ
ncbi:Sphingoid base hydroxylase 2 [Hibiscus syriacus]|uniref:Sphingoid base hydroxylase 2 n=1 Tax=Hibiscus syriacus TaxID=106335 RepID=A0A6A2YF14_HIBSY|nr:protein PHYTOCHROME KINASE SUBSTRATE 1-like [Hibiscus syriacus]KAE8673237.1 Sphingoid base hydroxylase 2 [Hibiscus syriacus]